MATGLGNYSRWATLALAVVLLVLAAAVDYATPPAVIIFPLYLFPVAIMSWYFSRTAGCITGVICALTTLFLALEIGGVSVGSPTPYWNAMAWLAGFVVLAFLVDARRQLGKTIEGMVEERTVALRAEVAERKRAEEAVHRLAAQLSGAEEAQRRQLAHDIHDTLGQTLTVIKMNLEASLRAADETQARRLKDSLSLIENMIRQTRTMTFELYPAMLDDLGLVPTIRRHLEQYRTRTGLKVTISESGESWKLPVQAANYLFRSVKELINNASKHGRAYEILVSVHWREGGVRVVVDDDGCGFDATRPIVPGANQGLGLAGIRERLLSMGGQVHVESEVGKGTRVILELSAKNPEKTAAPPETPAPQAVAP